MDNLLPSWHFLQHMGLPGLCLFSFLFPSRIELVSLSDTDSTEGLGKETKAEEQISQFSLFLEPVLSKGCTWGGVCILWLK